MKDEEVLWALTLEFVTATSDLHSTHGSTSVHGGIGGQTLTTHCGYTCTHPSHLKAQERYENAYYALTQYSHKRKQDEKDTDIYHAKWGKRNHPIEPQNGDPASCKRCSGRSDDAIHHPPSERMLEAERAVDKKQPKVGG